jgi:hypothetical protein
LVIFVSLLFEEGSQLLVLPGHRSEALLQHLAGVVLAQSLLSEGVDIELLFLEKRELQFDLLQLVVLVIQRLVLLLAPQL